jgi:subfamily B ATP-binding cassette protein MsbA
MQNYLKLIRFLRGHIKLFSVAVVTMFISGFFEIFSLSMLVPMVDVIFTKKKIVLPSKVPGFVQHLVDKLNGMAPNELLPLLLITFLTMLFLKNLLVFVYQYLMSDVSQRIIRDIRFQLYSKIQNLSLDYFSVKRTGELISRITHDTNLVENAVSYGLTDLFRQTFVIIFWIGTAFTIDPRAALIIFGIFPVIGYPMSQIGRKLRKISKGIQEKMADMNSLLLETISGVRLVKAFCTEDYEVDRFRRQNHEYYKLKMKSSKRLIIISPITEIIGGICGTILVVWFSHRLLNNELSFGIFILFFASIMSIISPIKKLGNVHALTQQALAANVRIYDILDQKPTVNEKPDALEIGEMKQSVKIDHVDFHYDKEYGTVLHDINLEVKKGELVAIVGPTGSGKSTLVNLIPRFYDPTKGIVTMDGVNLKDATFLSLRKQIGVVAQDAVLFNDTVKANISYGQKEMKQEQIEEAAKKAFAHQFIVKMPYGYDTVIGDRGFRLSGGEKQRISIARAILKNPPMLILDEATSQLDSESERYIQEALDKLMQGRTVVAIAHRLSTIMKADKIVVIEAGRIIDMGKHDQLLKSCALYEKLYKMQFQL